MKIDRLIAITMYLLNRETVSASTLAERFEVSKRTIQRDIETLNQAGIPIVSVYGAEGGYRILDGFRLTKQIANLDDYLNIIMALKGLHSAYDTAKIGGTLEKVLSTMQGGDQRIFVDFSVAREDARVNEHLQTIEKAIYNKTLLTLSYTNSNGLISTRMVEPLALSYKWYAWYMLAYCTLKQDYRLFKLPRIKHCELSNETFSEDHGDIETLLDTYFAKDTRPYYHVTLKCKGAIRQQVLEYLGTNITKEFENGDFILQLAGVPLERMWFSLLLGFGDQVEVLEPDDIKRLLKEKANEILALY